MHLKITGDIKIPTVVTGERGAVPIARKHLPRANAGTDIARAGLLSFNMPPNQASGIPGRSLLEVESGFLCQPQELLCGALEPVHAGFNTLLVCGHARRVHQPPRSGR